VVSIGDLIATIDIMEIPLWRRKPPGLKRSFEHRGVLLETTRL
jgi:hypothetical protein